MAGFRYLSSAHLLGFNRYKVRTLLRPPGRYNPDRSGGLKARGCVGVEGGRGQCGRQLFIFLKCYEYPSMKPIMVWASVWNTTRHCCTICRLSPCTHLQYNSVDTSPLSNYVMHPFWNNVVKVLMLSTSPCWCRSFTHLPLSCVARTDVGRTQSSYVFRLVSAHCQLGPPVIL